MIWGISKRPQQGAGSRTAGASQKPAAAPAPQSGADVRDLLPIGSVVLLKNGSRRLMIFGVKQTSTKTGVEYDYIGVVYPEGNIGSDGQFFFNHDSIAEVEFRGFEDEERRKFIRRLAAFYAKH